MFYAKLNKAWIDLNGGFAIFLGGRGRRGRPSPTTTKLRQRLAGVARNLRCSSSFVPGTDVLMADGTRKPIEDVKVGDKVLATDPETGKTRAQPVLGTITSKGDKNLVQITVNADAPALGWTEGDTPEPTTATPLLKKPKSGVLIATDTHPFWVGGDINAWVEAADLKPGMWLRSSAGTYVQITVAEHETTRHQRVHNLTIANLHTYYVEAGQSSVLVHNEDVCDLRVIATGQAIEHNRASVRAMPEGYGFSGVYDPTTGRLVARLSSGPQALVPQAGGHGRTNREMFGNSTETVGFVAIVRDGSLEVRWNSGSVNRRNFRNAAAPTQYREPIMEALRNLTGLEVSG
ncbi:polymorphic toxin-type HINT domain-containing protein [Actinomadura meyerae]|nr:polymorphic toxin-type HINT domain-containing protein [Actinomadura meyerae]